MEPFDATFVGPVWALILLKVTSCEELFFIVPALVMLEVIVPEVPGFSSSVLLESRVIAPEWSLKVLPVPSPTCKTAFVTLVPPVCVAFPPNANRSVAFDPVIATAPAPDIFPAYCIEPEGCSAIVEPLAIDIVPPNDEEPASAKLTP